MAYIPLVDFEDDYEILDEHPHSIRRISSDRCISTRSLCSKGYIHVYLNGRPYDLHRLIAKQFVPNDDPEHKTEVDHINHDRTDNHIENLRWVTRSTNQRNRTSYKGYDVDYIPYEDIPDDIIVLTRYNEHDLQDGYIYSFETDAFYYDTDEAFRVLPVCYKQGYPYVRVRDVDNKRITIMINTFKHINGLQ